MAKSARKVNFTRKTRRKSKASRARRPVSRWPGR